MRKRYSSHLFFIRLAIGLALCLAFFVPANLHAQDADWPDADWSDADWPDVDWPDADWSDVDWSDADWSDSDAGWSDADWSYTTADEQDNSLPLDTGVDNASAQDDDSAAAAAEQGRTWKFDNVVNAGYLWANGGWTEGEWSRGYLVSYTLGIRVDWWGIYANLRFGSVDLQRKDLRTDLDSDWDKPVTMGGSIGPRFFLDYVGLNLYGQASFAMAHYGYLTLGPEFSVGLSVRFKSLLGDNLGILSNLLLGLDFTYYIGVSKYWDHQKAMMVWGATHHFMPQVKLGWGF
ncbi:MAG: hypothetical protein FWC40_04225 [Proteobacteria bacterium]|nr:hypothetical protein [Pseudomonadota bacterium]MCL2325688.1 hypothetical protein [Pseudomonadota bacterium]